MGEPATTLERALVDAVAETFSDMAFVDALPADEPGAPADAQVFAIDVMSEQALRMVMRLSLDSKKAIAENIHGREWSDLHSVEIDDCLLEFLNVLAGSFGRNYWGDDSRYKLSFPSVEIQMPEEMGIEPPMEFWFDAEGTPISFVVAKV